GNLTLDEKDMIDYFEIPPGIFRKKDNTLRIAVKIAKDQNSDDILIGQLLLIRQAIDQLLGESKVEVSVRDANTDGFLPSRITIVDQHGSLQPVAILNEDHLTARTGIVYTGNGHASFSLPAGSYKIYASRGFEYGADSIFINVKSGDLIQKTLSIRHEVPATGWISCDPHIHTLTYSGHGDATVRDRVLTIAGEGLRLPVMTDHNTAVNIDTIVKKMSMDGWFTPVTGNEVTTAVGHFNVFPVSSTAAVTDYHVKDWNELSANIRKTDSVKVVVLNHARDEHNGFRPFDDKGHIAVAGKGLRGWALPANAMEVMNSGSQQTDPTQLYFDWMAMLNRGFLLAPVGSSDSHEVSRFLVGQARTYIRNSETNPSRVNVAEIIKNFAEGKVSVSFGLLTEIVVDSLYGAGDLVPASGNLHISIKVFGPSWVRANRITLYANGQKIREALIPPNATGGRKWQGKWIIKKPAHDVFLVAVAEGPATHVPFWPIVRPYEHKSPDVHPKLLGITGAVRIDADRDGHFTCAYDYARAIWDSSNKDINIFIGKLADYDEAVVIQAAAVLEERDIDVTGMDLAKALSNAPLKVRNGFKQFIKYWKISQAIQ
ncbi:MAG TPA: CehA/McbA family metallohydrolase, partial [Puia sp.]|nr:CehA/McbA family metallohydrolase [Puia sp.]